MNNKRQEIIAIASKTKDGRDVKIKAIITDGAINFKFNDAKIAKEFYFKQRREKPEQKIQYFERLNSFTEFEDGKTMEQLKTILINKLEANGMKDWTEKIANEVIKKNDN